MRQVRQVWQVCNGTLTAGLMMGAVLAAAAPSSGQNALGSGSALDGNLIEGTSRYNTAAPAPNFRGRNLLVTGNVAAGRGFRGTVGYAAEFDFRGVTGADDLYRERANSAFSAPSFITAGRTMELLRFGQYLNEVEYRKTTRGATVANAGDTRRGLGNFNNRLVLDRIAVSNTTSSIYDSVSDSRIVGMLLGPEGQRFSAVASSLTGVQIVPLASQGSLIGLSTYDMARAIQDKRSGQAPATIGMAFDGSFQNLLSAEARAAARAEPMTTRLEPQIRQARIEAGTEASYLEILQRVAERQAGPGVDIQSRPEFLSDMDRQFTELREALAAASAMADGQKTADDEASAKLPGSGLPSTAEAIAAIAEALRHGRTLDHYGTEDPTRFNELMRTGEQRLADGQYFWAERHFDRALRFTPGHPLAIAGMGHAQIGAGLHVPAALTLRRLLTTNPELIDVRYERELLPSLVRLDLAIEQLRDLIARVERDRSLRGFVLAYIGHQLDERALVVEGLGHMGNEPLRALLEAVWLD